MKQNKELEKMAWEVYTEALNKLDIPDNLIINKNDDGSFSCSVSLSNKFVGSIFIHFEPSTEMIKNLLGMYSSFDVLPLEIAAKQDRSIAQTYAYLFLKNFFIEVADTLSDSKEIPFLVLLFLLSDSEVDDLENKKNLYEQAKKQLEEFFVKRKQRTKERIEFDIQIFQQSNRIAIHLIDFYYEKLLPQWDAAKDCYKKIKDFNNWEKMLAISFEELPTDLIKRLGDSDTYAAMPSSIALEHAARFCGVKSDSVGLRTLQKYLQQSRKWIAENGDEKAHEEAKRYFQITFQEVVTCFQVAHFLNEKFPFEDYSLLHQQIAEFHGEEIKEIFIDKKPLQKDDEHEGNDDIH